MISDETFPIEFDDDIDSGQTSIGTTLTTADVSMNQTSTIEWSKPQIGSTSCERTVSTQQGDIHDESTSFVSLNVTEKDIAPMPKILPRAPSKKRISFSCHDLLAGQPGQRRNSYDHVQSKVKKIIEENAARRKPISRHKSMLISLQGSNDETLNYDGAEKNELIQELRQKSSRIIELVGKCDEKDQKMMTLEERCDEKDSRIYALEFDRSKMRLTFDKLRQELQELKEKEQHYKMQLAMTSPPSRNLRNVATQTHDELKVININPIVRELTFTTDVNGSLDQTHFSELNNASSDSLIPTPEVQLMDEIQLIDESKPNEVNIDEEVAKRNKKKTKKRGFFKLFSCVSVQSRNWSDRVQHIADIWHLSIVKNNW